MYIINMVKNLVKRARLAEMAGVSAPAVTKACKGPLKAAMVGNLIDLEHKLVKDYIAKKKIPIQRNGVDALYEQAVRMCTLHNRFTANHISDELGIGKERANRIVATMAVNGVIPKKLVGKQSRPGRPKKGLEKKSLPGPLPPPPSDSSTPAPPVYKPPEDITDFLDMTLQELIDSFGTDVRLVDWLRATKIIEAIEEKRIKNAAACGELVSRELVKNGVMSPIDTCHRRILTDCARSLSIQVPSMHVSGDDAKTIEKYIHDQISSFIKPAKAKMSRALRVKAGK